MTASWVVDGMQLVQTQLLAPLIGASCAETVLALDLAQTACFSLLLSKLLGLGIVAGSAIVKLPQIIRIRQARSAQGISFASYSLETLAIIIGLAYSYRQGYAFSTYGDGVFVTMQNLLILCLIHRYNEQYFKVFLVLVGYALVAYGFFSPALVPDAFMQKLQMAAVALGILSRIPQIMTNARTRSTGQVSVTTVFLQFAGALARVFTTLKELQDPVILTSYSASSLLLGVLLLQIWLYSGAAGARDGRRTSARKAKKDV